MMGADADDEAVAGGESDIARSFDRDWLAYELVREPRKARVYTAVLLEGPVARDELTEMVDDLSGTTIYNLLRELTETEYVNVDDSSEPYEYTARPIQAPVVGEDGDQTVFTITPGFVAVVSASDIRDDISLFVERHSLGMLAAAYDATIPYLDGEMSRRMAAEKLGLDTYEGLTITNEIESVIEEMRTHNSAFGKRIENEA